MSSGQWRAGVMIMVVAVAMWFLPLALPGNYFVTFAARLLAFVLLVGSFNLLMSYVSLTSFGHSALFGVGGYAAAIIIQSADVDVSVTLLGGLAAGAVVAGMIGPIVLRSSGAYFILLTLAIGQVMWDIAESWRSVTGGSDGMSIYSMPQLAFWALDEPVKIFRLTAVTTFSALGVLYLIVHSAFGEVLRGIRESPARMAALGYNVFTARCLAFVFSGALAGLAGGQLAVINRFISPDTMSVRLAVSLVLVVIMGGRGSFWGPLVTGVLLFTAEEVISTYTPLWPLVLGTIFICAVYVLRFDLLRFHWVPGTTRAETATRPQSGRRT